MLFSACIVNYCNEKMIDLCPVSAKGLNYSLLDSLGMLYVFQILSTSIFGYDLKRWSVTVFWFLVKTRGFIMHDRCQQNQQYMV